MSTHAPRAMTAFDAWALSALEVVVLPGDQTTCLSCAGVGATSMSSRDDSWMAACVPCRATGRDLQAVRARAQAQRQIIAALYWRAGEDALYALACLSIGYDDIHRRYIGISDGLALTARMAEAVMGEAP